MSLPVLLCSYRLFSLFSCTANLHLPCLSLLSTLDLILSFISLLAIHFHTHHVAYHITYHLLYLASIHHKAFSLIYVLKFSCSSTSYPYNQHSTVTFNHVPPFTRSAPHTSPPFATSMHHKHLSITSLSLPPYTLYF